MAFTTHPAERRLEATSFENPVDGPTHALLARSLTDVPGQRLGWAVGLASLVLALSAGAFAGGIATGLRLFRFPGDVAMRLQLDHGVIMTCFAVLPALLSTFGAARLPRQLRGPGLAAPAVAAGGVAAMAIGFLCLAVMPARTDIAVILWSVGVTLQAASTLATVANMRSPDLRLSDVSPFVWAQVAAHGLVAMLAPMLAAGMTRALLRGADPALVVRAFEAPLNAVALIAACGIVSLVVADARRPARSETRGTGVAFAVMAAGVVVWMHGALRGHALSGVWLEEIFLMPAGVALAGLWIAGLWRAHVAPRPALFWAAAFIAVLLGGAAASVRAPAAGLHSVAELGAVLAAFAGLYRWLERRCGEAVPRMMTAVHLVFTVGAILAMLVPSAVVPSALAGGLAGVSLVALAVVLGVSLARARPFVDAAAPLAARSRA